MKRKEIPHYDDVVAFHGHSCPGLAMGFRAAVAALEALNVERPDDEELVAIVENDACGVDAIQYVAGTTLGKGNLIFRDYGKHVYTFINRKTGGAVRVAQRADFTTQRIDPGISGLRSRVMAGTATPAEEKEFRERSARVVDSLLRVPAGEIFTVREVRAEAPGEARIFASVPCASCGEMVSESRARVNEGKIVCLPCYESYSRGW